MAEAYGPPNPFSLVRKKGKAAPKAQKPSPAHPVPAEVAPIGQTQPNMLVMDDPFAASLPIPSGMQSMPVPYSGPGSFDNRGQKVSQDAARQAQRHVYKTPDEYYSQLGTVMGSPLMQKLSQGVKGLEGLRDQYLQHAPVQADLSPLMGLADFVAQGKGNALRSYKRPDDYNDLVGKLAGLMQQEQGAAYNQANLAMNQVPLKAGDDTASVKAGMDEDRSQGFAIPRPASNLGGQIVSAERWYTDKTQKNLQDFAVAQDQLAALQSALDRGDIGSITRAMGLAARLLSGEKGVVTDRDIGRVLPKTIGMDFNALEGYLTNNPSVLMNPMTLIGIKEEVAAAKERLLKRYGANQQTFDDTLRGSPTLGGIPDRMGGAARARLNDESDKAPPAPQESDRLKEFKKLMGVQ